MAFTDLTLTGIHTGSRPAPGVSGATSPCARPVFVYAQQIQAALSCDRISSDCIVLLPCLSCLLLSISCNLLPLWWKQDVFSKPSLILQTTQKGFRKHSHVSDPALHGPRFMCMFVPCISSVVSYSPQPNRGPATDCTVGKEQKPELFCLRLQHVSVNTKYYAIPHWYNTKKLHFVDKSDSDRSSFDLV